MSRRRYDWTYQAFSPHRPKEYETKVIENGRLRWVCKITGRECPVTAQCRTCLYPMLKRAQEVAHQVTEVGR